MKNFRRSAPSVNAGSMADIAFLLLIFFLVTTTIAADKGILRKLPAECLNADCGKTINERNILRILINRDNFIMVEDSQIEIPELKEKVKLFIDNNGQNVCNYCNGAQLENSSDQRAEAIISLEHNAESNYGIYIDVQDQISLAYLELRTKYAKNAFSKSPKALTKSELKAVKASYPFALSEINVKR